MATRNSKLVAFQEKLDLYCSSEKAEAVLLVAQDSQLVRLLLAWDKIPVRRKSRLSEIPRGGSDGQHWAWLWENVTYSLEELAAVSGLSRDLVEKHMAVLQGNRLVHPDGTVNKYVAQYLRTKVLGLFRTKSSSSKNLAKKGKT